MKKKLVSLVLCMALLSSLTVSASADFTSNDSYNLADSKTYLQNLWSELDPNLSSSYSTNLRKIVGQILEKLPSPDYAGVLTSRASFNNSSYPNFVDMLGNALTSIYNSSAGIANRIVEVQTLITGTNNRLDTVDGRLTTINTNMQNLIAAFSQQNHTDFVNLITVLTRVYSFNAFSLDSSGSYSNEFVFGPTDWTYAVSAMLPQLGYDIVLSDTNDRTLYSRLKQLQNVLASDEDLQLKKDNKANEDAVTDGFVNGSSSKTSLGVSDFGNLKDVGGTFNDLSSLNGQSSISSFLSGLTSADTTGQGWFSEATRASLDSVSAPVSTTNLVRKTWRGEKSILYSVSLDTSVNAVMSPAPARAPVVDPDPYNMSGFEDNYNWLWGDAS